MDNDKIRGIISKSSKENTRRGKQSGSCLWLSNRSASFYTREPAGYLKIFDVDGNEYIMTTLIQFLGTYIDLGHNNEQIKKITVIIASENGLVWILLHSRSGNMQVYL